MEAIPEVPRPRHVLPLPETYSPSTLVEFETCPRRFYYTHVFAVPSVTGGLKESQDYGSAIHAYVEGGLRGERPSASRPVPEGASSGPSVPLEERWRAFEGGPYGRRAREYPLHPEATPPESGPARMVEVPWSLDVGGAEIRGRIDAIFVDEDGAFHIVDWKTGRPYEGYKTRLQLPLYALAANKLWDVGPEKMRLVYAFVPGDALVEVSTEGDFLGRAEEKVLGALGLIKGGRFEPTPSRYACSRCPVMGIGIAGCPTEVPEE